MAVQSLLTKNRLQEHRHRGGLSQNEVARITGVSLSTVCKHENGSRGLTKADIEAYAKLYKVSTHLLFFSEEEFG